MIEPLQGTVFSDTAFRAMEIGPLPPSPKKRMRIGEELQPVGTYAGIIPYLGTIQDVEVLQDHEKTDPEFESKDWWWDHQRIRFLNEKLGLKLFGIVVAGALGVHTYNWRFGVSRLGSRAAHRILWISCISAFVAAIHLSAGMVVVLFLGNSSYYQLAYEHRHGVCAQAL
ncbi:hypothetical protein [Marinobacter sp. MBR-105]